MNVQTQALPFDPASLRGLSVKLLASHHQNNYGGAVKRLNAIRGRLAATPFASVPGFELFSALIAVAAAVALFRYKVGVIPLLGACAAAGLAIQLAR